jgi:hypothetical protein
MESARLAFVTACGATVTANEFCSARTNALCRLHRGFHNVSFIYKQNVSINGINYAWLKVI